uniref:Uncharacterized protein n=1 Tax=Rhizophora mucronata TaxID=61149 RepID=A0A2P2P476_RHIMU
MYNDLLEYKLHTVNAWGILMFIFKLYNNASNDVYHVYLLF